MRALAPLALLLAAAPGPALATDAPLPPMGARTLPDGTLLAVGTQPKDGVAYFIDLTRLNRTGDKVQVFVYTVIDPPQQAGNAPMAQTVEADIFDCTARTVTVDGMTGYDDIGMPVALSHAEPARKPDKGSVTLMVLQTVCDGWRPPVHLEVTGHKAAYEAAITELRRARKEFGIEPPATTSP